MPPWAGIPFFEMHSFFFFFFLWFPTGIMGKKKKYKIWSTFLCFTLHVKIGVEQVSKLFPGIICGVLIWTPQDATLNDTLTKNLITSSHLYDNQMLKIGSSKIKFKNIDPIEIKPSYFSQVFKILSTLSNRFSWNYGLGLEFRSVVIF
jgi:hypothetical protein